MLAIRSQACCDRCVAVRRTRERVCMARLRAPEIGAHVPGNCLDQDCCAWPGLATMFGFFDAVAARHRERQGKSLAQLAFLISETFVLDLFLSRRYHRHHPGSPKGVILQTHRWREPGAAASRRDRARSSQLPRWSAARARGPFLLRCRREGAAGAPRKVFRCSLVSSSRYGDEAGEHQGAAIRTSALAALRSLVREQRNDRSPDEIREASRNVGR